MLTEKGKKKLKEAIDKINEQQKKIEDKVKESKANKSNNKNTNK